LTDASLEGIWEIQLPPLAAQAIATTLKSCLEDSQRP
jgi:hypothetical protein